jgi:hypothetical protein
MAEAVLMPVIVITSEVMAELGATPVLLVKLKAFGTGFGHSVAQEALAPPAMPLHDQVQGPTPATADAEPTEQRFADGAAISTLPWGRPQTPPTCPKVAVRETSDEGMTNVHGFRLLQPA